MLKVWNICTLVHFMYTLDICKCQLDRTVTIKTLHSELNKHRSYPSMCMSAVAAGHVVGPSWLIARHISCQHHHLHIICTDHLMAKILSSVQQLHHQHDGKTRSPWSVFAGHLYGDISAICFHSTDLTNICFGFKANVNCRHLRGSRFWLWVWISLENGKNLKELNIYRFHPAFAALLVFCHLKTTHISWLNEIVGSNTL